MQNNMAKVNLWKNDLYEERERGTNELLIINQIGLRCCQVLNLAGKWNHQIGKSECILRLPMMNRKLDDLQVVDDEFSLIILD